MQIKQLTEQDYETLCDWWNRWPTWEPPVRDFLPENGTGGFMIYSDDDQPVCAGFMYLTNSKVAWIEFIVSNPNYKWPDRDVLIKQLITYLTERCRELGYEFAYTSTKHSVLINKFESVGFTKGTVGSTELVMKLN